MSKEYDSKFLEYMQSELEWGAMTTMEKIHAETAFSAGLRAAEVKPIELPKEFFDAEQNSRGMFELSEDCMCGVVAAIKAAGGTVE